MISVIIPTLNEEKLLGATLSQFTPRIIQRYSIEVIVSDGGSTDHTLDIARKYAHKIVENVAGEKQTISLGRNLGAAAASGDVLFFLNADTLIADIDLFFERMIEKSRSTKIAALTCSVSVYPHEQREIDRWFHGFYNWFFSLMNAVGMGMGRGECHVIRKEAFERVHGYAPRIVAGEDYDMFRRLERIGRIAFIRELKVFESPRRYRRYGYIYVTASWFLNFLSVFFLRRSILSEWKPVR